MSEFILAIDQGTSSSRAIVLDSKGQIQNIAQKELKLSYPHNGWVEQDPEDIWSDVKFVCTEVLNKKNIKPEQIAGIAITNQRETSILWYKNSGKVLYNAIVWQDRRTTDLCERLKKDTVLVKKVLNKTGLPIDPYFSATKIKWILDNIDGARDAAKKGDLCFGTIDSFLLWRISGGKTHATDITNASRTMLYNIVEKKWDEELLDIFNIPANIMPEVKDNSCLFGTSKKDFIGAEIPITAMVGDQQAALFGQACFNKGMLKATYGTALSVVLNIGDKFKTSQNGITTTIGNNIGGEITYAMEGTLFVGGSAVQWLRDSLGIIKSAQETESLAKSVSDSCGVYMVPAFVGLGAPYWEPNARGAILGLTRGTTKAHIVRATLEAQAYQTYDLLSAMNEDSGNKISEMRVDGGMAKNNWACQFIADITQVPLLRPEITETTVMGAAYMAGLHMGIFSSLEDIQKNWKCEKTFEPNMNLDERDNLYAGWKHAIKQVLA